MEEAYVQKNSSCPDLLLFFWLLLFNKFEQLYFFGGILDAAQPHQDITSSSPPVHWVWDPWFKVMLNPNIVFLIIQDIQAICIL